MSEEEFPIAPPTSPNMKADGDLIGGSQKAFSDAMTLDLTDEEIGRAAEICMKTCQKHREIWKRKYPFDSMEQALDLVEEFEKELTYRMAEGVNCLVRVDGPALLAGEGLVLEWLGKIDTDPIYKYGMDHEKKEYEVKKATARGEDFLGQKD